MIIQELLFEIWCGMNEIDNRISLARNAWKKCSNYVANEQWPRKNCFQHFWNGWNSFNRLHIDVQAEESDFQTSAEWSRPIFSVDFAWWTRTWLYRKWPETAYLRDNKEKYLGYSSRNSLLKYVWCVEPEQDNNNKNNGNSDSSHFYWHIRKRQSGNHQNTRWYALCTSNQRILKDEQFFGSSIFIFSRRRRCEGAVAFIFDLVFWTPSQLKVDRLQIIVVAKNITVL